ncbi:MAG: DUF4834 family protein [Alistipes sp.]|nr:DUF4834 family protein [Alistipes sp.]
MAYLKIIFYGLLSAIERNPIFFMVILLLAVFAPFVIKWALWVILGLIAFALLGMLFFVLRFRKAQRDLNNQFRQAGGASGFNAGTGFGGFSHFASSNMSLEELVRQMQAQADAAQRKNTTTTAAKEKKIQNDKSGDYVDFEEVR